MSNKRRFKIKVVDKDYTIVGDTTPEHMQMVTDIVNEQLQQIMSLSPQLSREEAAILLAINAVSDQVKKEEKCLDLEEKYGESQS